MKYTHLSQTERIKLETYLSAGLSQSEIAKKMGRDKSTISREVRRNTNKRGIGAKKYTAQKAHGKYKRRLKEKTKRRYFTKGMKGEVLEKLAEKWSPEIISGRARAEGRKFVSHETVYLWIYRMQRSNKRSDRKFKDMWRDLAHAGRRRRKRSRAYKKRGVIPNRAPMEKRPVSAGNRSRNGHMEADLVIGKNHGSGLLVMTDRKMRYTLIRKIRTKSSGYIREKIMRIIKGNSWIKTITFDNDLAFSEHERLPVGTFFTRPYCSQDKGTVENKNKVIRMKCPKGFDFNELSDKKIQLLQKWINNRPMKMFKFKSPIELFEKSFLSNVALNT